MTANLELVRDVLQEVIRIGDLPVKKQIWRDCNVRCREALAALTTYMGQPGYCAECERRGWRPIESAPLGQRVLIYRGYDEVSGGHDILAWTNHADENEWPDGTILWKPLDEPPQAGCSDRPAPPESLHRENAQLKLAIAQAALNIIDNPHGAISDTLWMSSDGCTMWEHLIGQLPEIDFVGLPDDEQILRNWIKEQAGCSDRPAPPDSIEALLARVPDCNWSLSYQKTGATYTFTTRGKVLRGLTPQAAILSALEG